MSPAAHRCQNLGHLGPGALRHRQQPGQLWPRWRQVLGWTLRVGLAWLAGLMLAGGGARAQGVELATLQLERAEGALTLEFSARVTLPRPAEEALYRGVPLYFVAEATLWRNRWYWRDDRIGRVVRSWRVAYQPLTGSWRVGLGGLNQTFATLGEALASASRSANWKLAELRELEGGGHYVEFSYRLDTSQLPGPMQFGFAGLGEWAIGVSRSLRVEAAAP